MAKTTANTRSDEKNYAQNKHRVLMKITNSIFCEIRREYASQINPFNVIQFKSNYLTYLFLWNMRICHQKL